MAKHINNSGNNNQFFSGSGTVNIGSINNNSGSKDSNQPAEKPSAEEQWKEDVYSLVTEGLLKEALTLIAKSSNNKLQAVQILGRLHKLEENTIAGIMTKNEEGIEHNNIVKAIILLTSTS